MSRSPSAQRKGTYPSHHHGLLSVAVDSVTWGCGPGQYEGCEQRPIAIRDQGPVSARGSVPPTHPRVAVGRLAATARRMFSGLYACGPGLCNEPSVGLRKLVFRRGMDT